MFGIGRAEAAAHRLAAFALGGPVVAAAAGKGGDLGVSGVTFVAADNAMGQVVAVAVRA